MTLMPFLLAVVASALGPNGFGPLSIGMSLDQAKAAAGGGLRVEQAAGGSTCRYAKWSQAPGLGFMFNEGRLARIDVSSGSVAAEGGVKIGDSPTRVIAAYGKATLKAYPNKYDPKASDIVVTPAGARDRRIIFFVENNRVRKFRAGRLPEVEYSEGCS